MLTKREMNKKLYGFAFEKKDVQYILDALKTIGPGKLIEDIDTVPLAISPQGLLSKTEAELEFYMNHDRFSVDEGSVRDIFKRASLLKKERLVDKRLRELEKSNTKTYTYEVNVANLSSSIKDKDTGKEVFEMKIVNPRNMNHHREQIMFQLGMMPGNRTKEIELIEVLKDV